MKKAALALCLAFTACGGAPDGMPPVGERCVITLKGGEKVRAKPRSYEGPFLVMTTYHSPPQMPYGGGGDDESLDDYLRRADKWVEQHGDEDRERSRRICWSEIVTWQ